jgi:uncharacterized membrane protein
VSASETGGQRLALRRVVAALALGAIAGLIASFFVVWQAAVLLGWMAAASVFLASVWITIHSMDATQTKSHATTEDPSRILAHALIIGASIAILGGVVFVLLKAGNSVGDRRAIYIAIGVVSVFLAWTTVHTVFTLRYAHLYYSDQPGGIDFNEGDAPDYRDFAYLAFTLGMTFQVSDTNLSTKAIRRAALSHGLISFVFGFVILGLMINVVAGLLH